MIHEMLSSLKEKYSNPGTIHHDIISIDINYTEEIKNQLRRIDTSVSVFFGSQEYVMHYIRNNYDQYKDYSDEIRTYIINAINFMVVSYITEKNKRITNEIIDIERNKNNG